MVIYENLDARLVKAYSDKDVFIANEDGDMYAEAIDLISLHREYTETDIPIEDEEATIEDYEEALREVGVISDEKE